MKSYKIFITEKEDKTIPLLNEYMKYDAKGGFWYKRKIHIKNLTSTLDNINGNSLLQIICPDFVKYDMPKKTNYDSFKILLPSLLEKI